MVVVFPAPLGPRNANNSPSAMCRERFSTATLVPYVRDLIQLDHAHSEMSKWSVYSGQWSVNSKTSGSFAFAFTDH